MRLPAIYLSHGGGPWPFVDVPFIPPGTLDPLKAYLGTLVTSLSARPRAALDDPATLPIRMKALEVHVSGVQFG